MCTSHKVVLFRTPSIGNVSTAGASSSVPFTVRYDKLDKHEIKDLLICFIYIVKNLAEGGYSQNIDKEVILSKLGRKLFAILTLSLKTLQ